MLPFALLLLLSCVAAEPLAAHAPLITPAPLLERANIATLGYYTSTGSNGSVVWESFTYNADSSTYSTSSFWARRCAVGSTCTMYTSCSEGYLMAESTSLACTASSGGFQLCTANTLYASYGATQPHYWFWCDSPTRTGKNIYAVSPTIAAANAGQAPITDGNSQSTTLSQSSSTASTTPPPTSTASETSTSTPPPPPAASKSNTGAIVGGVVGGVAALAIIGVGALLLLRRKKSQKNPSNLPPGVAEGEQKYEQFSHVSSPPPAVFAPARQYDPYEAPASTAPAEVAGSSPVYGGSSPGKTTYANNAPTFGGELPTSPQR